MKLPLLCALIALVSGGRSTQQTGEERQTADLRPNLVLLVTDDHPFDALGSAGHPVLRTPHLDGLAERGVRFTHAFVTTPICAASRASLFTGRYERAHGYTFGQPALDAALVRESYPVLLREAGYRVGFVGKFGVRVRAEDRAAMFEEDAPGTYPYLPRAKNDAEAEGDGEPARHLTERNTDRAIEFVQRDDPRPFCLSFSFQAPHAEDHNPEQFVWPESCDDLYEDAELPTPANADPAFFEALPEFLRTGLNRERWGWRFDTPEKHDRMVKGYYRMLSGVDLAVGRLLAALDEAGLRERTVVVVIGDNGYFLGERGYAGKWTMHDRSTRVPLLFRDPRRADSTSARVIDAFALNVDVAPTLLELAGVETPEGMQGRSLVPLLDGEVDALREDVFTEHLWRNPRIPRTEGLRTRGWKYIRYPDHPEYEELYDLTADPEEGQNLATDERHAERLRDLRERAAGAAKRVGRPERESDR